MLQAKATFLRLEESLNNIINTLGKYKVVNEKNAVVESPKLNLTLAKAETKDINYSELCRLLRWKLWNKGLFMWKLNYGIRKGCTANDCVQFLFIFAGNWLLLLIMVKKLCFFMMINFMLTKEIGGFTRNAWFNPKAINHLLRSIFFPWKGFTFPFEYFFENFKCLASSFYANANLF